MTEGVIRRRAVWQHHLAHEEGEVALIADSNVTTFMGSLVIGVGEGRVRPYAQLGTGLVRSRTDLGDLFDAVSVNEWGITVGGGAGGGIATLPLQLPAVTGYIGQSFYTQWVVLDPLALNGLLSVTAGLHSIVAPLGG